MDEAAFRELISGATTGPVAAAARGGLRLLSGLYGTAVAARNLAFDVGLRRAHRADVPVVSVGNLTTGGTGKTPVVAWIANWLVEQNKTPVILSRGYRALPESVNDEKLVLDQLCPGVAHLQDPDRVASAEVAVVEHEAGVLVLDDGFQHRRLHRDLDVVLIDALNPFGYDALLPRGLLRESVGALRRADLVLLTRADQCSDDVRAGIRESVVTIAPDVPCLGVSFRPRRYADSAGETLSLEALAGAHAVAFCGIGNPEAFEQTLTDSGLLVRRLVPFGDHHHYDADDLARLAEIVESLEGITAVVTTQKDLVKLSETQIAGRPLRALTIEADFGSGESEMVQMLEWLLDDGLARHCKR